MYLYPLRTLCICLLTAGLLPAANAALVSRLNGLAVYDTDQDITWLANTRGGDNLTVNWTTANNWATNLSFGGYEDWRLPSAMNSDGTGPCSGYNCNDSEMGHLFYQELGGTAGTPLSSSNIFAGSDPDLALFTDLSNHYWTSTETASSTYYFWNFSFAGGSQGSSWYRNAAGAWAVRDGDVSPVPLPAALPLFASALGLMGFTGWKRRKSS